MRVLLATAGGFGDTGPFIPLGVGLAEAGHDVTALVPSLFTERFHAHGLNTRSYDWGWDAVARPDLLDAWLGSDDAAHKHVISVWMRQIAEGAVVPFLESLRECDAVVLGPMLMTMAAQASGAIRRPMAMLQHTPGRPTLRGDSHYGAPDSSVGVGNLVRGAREAVSMMAALDPGLAVVAAHLGERPLGRWARDARLARFRMVTAVSPVLAPANARSRWWPTTGYLFVPPTGSLTPRTDAFLAAGNPPVHVGLGSASTPAARTHAERIIDTVVAAGRRVVAPKNLGVDASRYSADVVCFTDFEPYEQLYPRCALAIHQGGVGTQAIGFVSDVPQFVTSLTVDHAYFGRRGHELGIGPPPVHLSQVRPEHVRQALTFADLPQTRHRAAELGARVRAEDGLGNALRFLDRALSLT